jgi:hypothetical protein
VPDSAPRPSRPEPRRHLVNTDTADETIRYTADVVLLAADHAESVG